MAHNGSHSGRWELNYSDHWAKYVNSFGRTEDWSFANDFLRLFDTSFRKNVNSQKKSNKSVKYAFSNTARNPRHVTDRRQLAGRTSPRPSWHRPRRPQWVPATWGQAWSHHCLRRASTSAQQPTIFCDTISHVITDLYMNIWDDMMQWNIFTWAQELNVSPFNNLAHETQNPTSWSRRWFYFFCC